MNRNFLVIEPEEGIAVLKGLASSARISMLKLLHEKGPMNVNEIAAVLSLPQSTVSTNIQVLEDAGLIRTERAKKGNRKICYPTAEKVLVVFKSEYRAVKNDAIEVSMPIGLYTG
ncbi:metalloregulator ArsR/SmtB family transcription factor, partial [Mesorhizobium sp. M0815]